MTKGTIVTCLLSLGVLFIATQATWGDLSANRLSGNKLAANRLAGNKLATNRLAGNRLAGNKLAANRLAGNVIAANEMTMGDAGDGAVLEVVGLVLPDGTELQK